MALLDSNQQPAVSYRYDAFGVLKSKTGGLDQPFQFSTKRYDESTGLSYYGYRFYNPAIGRWLTRDPLGEAGGVNLYGFVQNSPVNFIDPWGFYGIDVHYFKTLEWALKAGIETRIATKIASANQRVDEAIMTGTDSYYKLIISTLTFGSSLHFRDRDYAVIGLKQSLEMNDIKMFGKFLHIFQDSFSHAGNSWPLGHASKGTEPDIYCENSKRDTSMRNATMFWLKEFEHRMGAKYHPAIRNH
jgi:RHS repeat-associated protein